MDRRRPVFASFYRVEKNICVFVGDELFPRYIPFITDKVTLFLWKVQRRTTFAIVTLARQRHAMPCTLQISIHIPFVLHQWDESSIRIDSPYNEPLFCVTDSFCSMCIIVKKNDRQLNCLFLIETISLLAFSLFVCFSMSTRSVQWIITIRRFMPIVFV